MRKGLGEIGDGDSALISECDAFGMVEIDLQADDVCARVSQWVEHDDGSALAAGIDVLGQMPAGHVVDAGGQVVGFAPAAE